MESSTDSTRYATSLLKSLDILEALGDDPEVSLSEVSRRAGLGKATVHRVLTTLVSRGYVERVGTAGKYRLGIRAFELGSRALANRDVRTVAREPMRALLSRVGEVVNLNVPAGDGLVVLDQIEGPRMVQMRARIGDRVPLDTTASGRAYLSARAPEWLAARFPHLVEELAVVRSRGFALDDREYQADLRCAAAPIRDAQGGVVAVVGISAPAYRMSLHQLAADVGPAVAATAAEISESLGCTRTPLRELAAPTA